MRLQVNWGLIPEEFKFAAQDRDKFVFAYVHKPDFYSDADWIPSEGGWLRLEDEIISYCESGDCSDSLIERPTEDVQEEITLTLRDQIAISILPAVYTTYCKNIEEWRYGVALYAYMMADAMLAARTHKQGK